MPDARWSWKNKNDYNYDMKEKELLDRLIV